MPKPNSVELPGREPMIFCLWFGQKAVSEFERVERGALLREFPNPP